MKGKGNLGVGRSRGGLPGGAEGVRLWSSPDVDEEGGENREVQREDYVVLDGEEIIPNRRWGM